MPWSTRKRRPRPGRQEAASDFPEPENTSDFLALMNALFPRTLDLRSWPRYRQGGAVRQWMTGGAHNYTDPNGFTQMGSAVWTAEAGSTHAWINVTLPSGHSGLPVAFATIMETSPVSTSAWCMARPYHLAALHRGLALDWWSVAPITMITIAWLVYGPGAAQPSG